MFNGTYMGPATTTGTPLTLTTSGVQAFMNPGRGRQSYCTAGIAGVGGPWSDYAINPWVNWGGTGNATWAPCRRSARMSSARWWASPTALPTPSSSRMATCKQRCTAPPLLPRPWAAIVFSTAGPLRPAAPLMAPLRSPCFFATTPPLRLATNGVVRSRKACYVAWGTARFACFPIPCQLGAITTGVATLTISTSLQGFLTPNGGEAVTLPD